MARGTYARFYALLRKNPHIDKDSIVMQFTDGRTTHLHEMKPAEYDEMCDMIEYGGAEEQAARERDLKKARSNVLLRIGRLGINTVDNWEGIDAFCQSPKIAGKRFASMTTEELKELVPKLESILRKKRSESMEPASPVPMYRNILHLAKTNPNQIPS